MLEEKNSIMKISKLLRFAIIALFITALSSCSSIDDRKVGFVSVEKVRLNNPDMLDCSLRLFNNLSYPITLSQGRIEIVYRERILASLSMTMPVKIKPIGEQSVDSQWRMKGEAVSLAATIAAVALGRNEDDLYINFEAKVSARGISKTIERRRVPAKSFIMSINSLLL